MAWSLLFVAGILEIVWAYALKQSFGLTRPGALVVAGLAMVASIVLLALAMRSLPLGTAYPIWTGIGALGTFLLGVVVFGETLSMTRVLAVLLIVTGIVLLTLATPGS